MIAIQLAKWFKAGGIVLCIVIMYRPITTWTRIQDLKINYQKFRAQPLHLHDLIGEH